MSAKSARRIIVGRIISRGQNWWADRWVNHSEYFILLVQASLVFLGATSGPSLGLFMLGAFFPIANATVSDVSCLLLVWDAIFTT
jgi:hypothetical protein